MLTPALSQRGLIGPVGGRRLATPALERSGKCALLREAKQEGDIGDRLCRVVEIAHGKIVAYRLQRTAVGHIVFCQFALQRSGAEAHGTGQVGFRRLP